MHNQLLLPSTPKEIKIVCLVVMEKINNWPTLTMTTNHPKINIKVYSHPFMLVN